MSHSIEISGTIIKKESLVAISSDISNNILILETVHAFPGYNGIIPEEKVPGSLFLITKKKHSKESVIRSAMALSKSLKLDLDLASSRITLRNTQVSAIRIKGLNNYSALPQLIQGLMDEGYRFEKFKTTNEFSSIIQVKKEFLLEEVENGFYSDKTDEETHYFALKKELKWYAFEKAVMDIKYNIDDINFDAALAIFYRTGGVVDLVRIYKKDLRLDELKMIKNKFCDYIRD
jgi:hypothetical protein